MKRTIFLLVLLLTSVNLIAQARIEFKQSVYNYDTIEQGDDGWCFFTFRNTGNEPLMISSASSSCGCTMPDFSRKPILPGKSGTIRVRYNTSLKGDFKKTIVVKSNATNQPVTILQIKGQVKKRNLKEN